MHLELSQVLSLLVVLCRLGVRNMLTEVCVRVAIVAVRTNLSQLIACRTAMPVLTTLNTLVYNYTKSMQVTMFYKLLRIHIILQVCVYSSNHGVLHIIGSSRMILQKNIDSSVHSSVCNAVKITRPFFIIHSSIIRRLVSFRASWHIQETDVLFSENYFPKAVDQILLTFSVYFYSIACILVIGISLEALPFST